jgi:integrase
VDSEPGRGQLCATRLNAAWGLMPSNTGAAGPDHCPSLVLANVINARYQALVLLAAFTSLRWGELGALTRSDINLTAATVRVGRQLSPARVADSPSVLRSQQRALGPWRFHG